MKHCSRHITDLNTALRRKGLGHLINDDPERNRVFAERWLKGTATAEEFDPRIVAVMEIYSKASQLGIAPGKEQCPLCIVPRVLQDARAGESWIDNVTDLMVIAARTNGLRVG